MTNRAPGKLNRPSQHRTNTMLLLTCAIVTLGSLSIVSNDCYRPLLAQAQAFHYQQHQASNQMATMKTYARSLNQLQNGPTGKSLGSRCFFRFL